MLEVFGKGLIHGGILSRVKAAVKELQWLMPMVWPPERATTSVGSKFLVARLERMAAALAKGAGKFCNVAFLVAKLSPSRLPNGTS